MITNPQNNNNDLLSDPKFMDWIAHPNSELDEHWNAWVNTHPERKEEVEEAKAFLKALDFAEPIVSAINKDDLLAKIHVDMAKPIKIKRQSRVPQGRIWWAVAASIALLFVVLMTIDWTPNSFAVPYGEMEKIALPDGSRVVLNANSTLRFEPRWNAKTTREVWLEGEAFFEVASEPKVGAPAFVVHTSRGDINVLGTTFNVRDRKNNFGVVLTEGSVMLSLPQSKERKAQEVAMKPGEFVNLNLDDHTIDKTTIKTELYTAWIEGKLVFENSSISYLASVIEDQYGYQVKIANEALLERKLTGTLNNPSLEVLIQTIAMAFDLEVKETADRTLTISY